MRLKNAARRFDTCPVLDAYLGTPLFKVQASTFQETSFEGSTAAKRVISVAPELVMPAHSCLLALGQVWIVGEGNPDEWAGEAIRKGYWTKLATDSMAWLTPGQAALGSSGTAIFASKKYLRESLNGSTDVELDPVWEIYVSASAPISRAYFLRSGTTLYRVRIAYKDLDGFLTLQSDEVDEPSMPITFTLGEEVDPVTEQRSAITVTVGAVVLDYAKSYTKLAATDVKSEAGDISVIVADSAMTPKVGQNFMMFSGKFSGSWRVVAAQAEIDAWKIHARRV